jgi:hypothetical protein
LILFLHPLYLVFALIQGHLTLASRPPFPEEGPIVAKVAPAEPEALEAPENQDWDGFEGFLEGSDSTQSPPRAESEEQDAGKKRKHPNDLTSLGTSKPKDVSQDQSSSRTLLPLYSTSLKLTRKFFFSGQ